MDLFEAQQALDTGVLPSGRKMTFGEDRILREAVNKTKKDIAAKYAEANKQRNLDIYNTIKVDQIKRDSEYLRPEREFDKKWGGLGKRLRQANDLGVKTIEGYANGLEAIAQTPRLLYAAIDALNGNTRATSAYDNGPGKQIKGLFDAAKDKFGGEMSYSGQKVQKALNQVMDNGTAETIAKFMKDHPLDTLNWIAGKYGYGATAAGGAKGLLGALGKAGSKKGLILANGGIEAAENQNDFLQDKDPKFYGLDPRTKFLASLPVAGITMLTDSAVPGPFIKNAMLEGAAKKIGVQKALGEYLPKTALGMAVEDAKGVVGRGVRNAVGNADAAIRGAINAGMRGHPVASTIANVGYRATTGAAKSLGRGAYYLGKDFVKGTASEGGQEYGQNMGAALMKAVATGDPLTLEEAKRQGVISLAAGASGGIANRHATVRQEMMDRDMASRIQQARYYINNGDNASAEALMANMPDFAKGMVREGSLAPTVDGTPQRGIVQKPATTFTTSPGESAEYGQSITSGMGGGYASPYQAGRTQTIFAQGNLNQPPTPYQQQTPYGQVQQSGFSSPYQQGAVNTSYKTGNFVLPEPDTGGTNTAITNALRGALARASDNRVPSLMESVMENIPETNVPRPQGIDPRMVMGQGDASGRYEFESPGYPDPVERLYRLASLGEATRSGEARLGKSNADYDALRNAYRESIENNLRAAIERDQRKAEAVRKRGEAVQGSNAVRTAKASVPASEEMAVEPRTTPETNGDFRPSPAARNPVQRPTEYGSSYLPKAARKVDEGNYQQEAPEIDRPSYQQTSAPVNHAGEKTLNVGESPSRDMANHPEVDTRENARNHSVTPHTVEFQGNTIDTRKAVKESRGSTQYNVPKPAAVKQGETQENEGAYSGEEANAEANEDTSANTEANPSAPKKSSRRTGSQTTAEAQARNARGDSAIDRLAREQAAENESGRSRDLWGRKLTNEEREEKALDGETTEVDEEDDSSPKTEAEERSEGELGDEGDGVIDPPTIRFSIRTKPAPKKTVKAYKLFRMKDGKIYPLLVKANNEVPVGQWLDAEEGERAVDGRHVKAKHQPLHYRPGWHASDHPAAKHIGGTFVGETKPGYRKKDQVWAEVEMAADRDWQSEANKRGKKKDKYGKEKFVAKDAEINDQIPVDGYYRYKTNPNMMGNWLIGGAMRVVRILTRKEVREINKREGIDDLPLLEELKDTDEPPILYNAEKDSWIRSAKSIANSNRWVTFVDKDDLGDTEGEKPKKESAKSEGRDEPSGEKAPSHENTEKRGSEAKFATKRKTAEEKAAEAAADRQKAKDLEKEARKGLFGGAAGKLLDNGVMNIVGSVKDLPRKIKGPIIKANVAGDVQALYDPDSKKTYFIARNIGKGEMAGLIIHEVGVHAFHDGDERAKALYKRAQQIVKNGLKSKDAKVRELCEAVQKRLDDASPAENVKGEETLAYLAQEALDRGFRMEDRGPIGGFFHQMAQTVREWCTEHHIPVNNLTLEDLVEMAQRNVSDYADLRESQIGDEAELAANTDKEFNTEVPTDIEDTDEIREKRSKKILGGLGKYMGLARDSRGKVYIAAPWEAGAKFLGWVGRGISSRFPELANNFNLAPLTKEMRIALRRENAEIARAQKRAIALAKEMENWSQADRDAVSDLIENTSEDQKNYIRRVLREGRVPPIDASKEINADLPIDRWLVACAKAGTIHPEKVVKTAMMMSSVMTMQTNELVRMGMLSEEAADRWRGRYLPRYYDNRWRSVRERWQRLTMPNAQGTKGIKGDHLHMRGILKNESVQSFLNDTEVNTRWEIRDPRYEWRNGQLMRRYTVDGEVKIRLADPEKDRITYWRDYTKGERERMGEIRDAAYRFTVGYMEVQKDIALGHLFDSIANTPDVCSSTPRPGWVEVPDTVIPGTGGVKRFGRLAGMYVKRDVFNAINPATMGKMRNSIIKTYDHLISLWKEGKTALNPASHMNNTVGNIFNCTLAGVPPGDPAYFRALKDFITGSDLLEEANNVGLFAGNFSREEFASMMPPELRKLMDAGNEHAFADGMFNALCYGKTVRGVARKAYDFEDSYFKYTIYRKLRKEGLSPAEAADYATHWIPTYNDLPIGAQWIKKVIPFFSFTYKEAPLIAEAVLKYPWRCAGPIVVMNAINIAMYALAASDDDDDDDIVDQMLKAPTFEEKARLFKKFYNGIRADQESLDEYQKGMTAFFTPKTLRWFNDAELGNAQYWNVENFQPGGNFLDVTNQAGGMPFPAVFTPNHPLFSWAVGFFTNTEMYSGKDIVDHTLPQSKQWLQIAKWSYKQFAPGIAVGSLNFDRVMDGIANATGSTLLEYLGYTGVRHGDPQTFSNAAMNLGGIKIRAVDHNEIFQRNIQALRGDMGDITRAQKKNAKLYRRGDITRDTFLDKKETLRKQRLEVAARKKEVQQNFRLRNDIFGKAERHAMARAHMRNALGR